MVAAVAGEIYGEPVRLLAGALGIIYNKGRLVDDGFLLGKTSRAGWVNYKYRKGHCKRESCSSGEPCRMAIQSRKGPLQERASIYKLLSISDLLNFGFTTLS